MWCLCFWAILCHESASHMRPTISHVAATRSRPPSHDSYSLVLEPVGPGPCIIIALAVEPIGPAPCISIALVFGPLGPDPLIIIISINIHYQHYLVIPFWPLLFPQMGKRGRPKALVDSNSDARPSAKAVAAKPVPQPPTNAALMLQLDMCVLALAGL